MIQTFFCCFFYFFLKSEDVVAKMNSNGVINLFWFWLLVTDLSYLCPEALILKDGVSVWFNISTAGFFEEQHKVTLSSCLLPILFVSPPPGTASLITDESEQQDFQNCRSCER